MNISKYIRVETFQFIDNLEHIIRPEEVLENAAESVEIVKNAFLSAGWEGDGDIGLIWLPPFVNFHGGIDNQYIWHVKQSNNGISYIGFEEHDYNGESSNKDNGFERIAETITATDSEVCLEAINKYRTLLSGLDEYSKVEKPLPVELYEATINSLHSSLVSEFIDYVDYVYLRIIQHIFECNNTDKLVLSKLSVTIPLDEISKNENSQFNSYIIEKRIMSSIWNDFKFRPVKEQIKEICKAIDYQTDDIVKNTIISHIEIRNSFQHHFGQFTPDMEKKLGIEHLDLIDKSGKTTSYKTWEDIKLSIPEVLRFCDSLETFIKEYEKQIDIRMSYKLYSYKKGNDKSSFEPLSIETDE